ncbi:MAG: GDSL-type esterase/lipase family protein [Planctomycetota bacterium]
MPFHPNRRTSRRLATSALLAAASALPLHAAAEQIDIMAIGDSITWGFQYDTGSVVTQGGWRVPLAGNLASDGRFLQDFGYVGVKGDNNTSTVGTETGRVSGPPVGDDFGDGIANTTDFLHEGYSGWAIDTTPYFVDGTSSDSDENLLDGRNGVFENLASQGGAIDPSTADVVMIALGANDVFRQRVEAGTRSDNASYLSAAERLNALIEQIKLDSPDATILVSNVLPVVQDRDPFSANIDPNDTYNTNADLLNDDLLDSFFGGAFDSDNLAAHSVLDDVFLLDTNSAFLPDRTDPDDYLNTFNNDFLHPTVDGYAALASIYTEAFADLGIGTTAIPEPATALLLIAGTGLIVGRRRRRAA